jgi:hypothetical protein
MKLYGVLRRHWLGNFSIAFSLCVGALLPATFIGLSNFTISLINYAVASWSINFVFPFIELILVAVGLALTLCVWLTGVWRSASRSRLLRANGMSSGLAHFAVILILFSATRFYLVDIVPLFGDAWANVIEDPAWGPRGVEFSESDKGLIVHGYITRSVAAAFKAELAQHHNASVVIIESNGGRLLPAIEMMRTIRDRHLDTRVSSICSSACVIAFLGGRHRVLVEGGRLGFHAASAGGFIERDAFDGIIDELEAQGISRGFLSKAFSTPEVWFPTETELREAGVITTTMN